MATEQVRVRRESFWQAKRLAVEAREPRKRRVWLLCVGAQPVRKADDESIIHPHQAAVEGAVVERVQAKAISWVQAIMFVLRPRTNMACHEQLRNR